MLGVGVLVVVAVVVVLVVLLGGSNSKHSSTIASTPTGTSSAGTSTGTSTTKPQVVAQVNLNPPSGTTSSAKGVGLVVKLGSAYGMIIEAQHVAPNSHNFYAVWLYNSPTDSLRLGFVSPAVGKSGKLQVETPLPANAGHYKQLLMSVETQSAPKTPGTLVLEGQLTGVPATG